MAEMCHGYKYILQLMRVISKVSTCATARSKADNPLPNHHAIKATTTMTEELTFQIKDIASTLSTL